MADQDLPGAVDGHQPPSVPPRVLGGETSQTLDRGIRLLQALAAAGPAGMTVSQLSADLGVGRPVVYRLVATLAQHDLVRRFSDGQIRMGVGLRTMAMAAESTIRRLAQPALGALADSMRATAHLTFADGDEAVAVAVEEPRWSDLHASYRVGSAHPITQGAAGRAILAGRDGADRLVSSVGELQAGAHGYAVPLLGVPGLEASVGVVALGPLDPTTAEAEVRSAASALAAVLTAE
jgi:DNA-binding IclR family transcriptional regulator